MCSSFDRLVLFAVAGALLVASAPQARADGAIDPKTVIVIPHGTFAGVKYTRYEAMFQGVSSAGRAYRVPCQVIAPAAPADGSGLCLFDWLNRSAIATPFGRELAIGRIALTDDFLFGYMAASYATVRCDPAGIGKPWSDGSLNTATEFIQSAGDEFDIVVDFVKVLSADPVAELLLGPIERMAAFGESSSGGRLRGLLRLDVGKGLFDFSLVGGAGRGFLYPKRNDIGSSSKEMPPLAGAGLEIDFNTEADVIVSGAADARHAEPNYRAYEFAGCSHVPGSFAALLGLADADRANPADPLPFVRALFVAGNDWCDGVEPPASIWLGAPGDSRIVRDADGNALVTSVGGQAVNTTGYRLPEVAVGKNQYIAFDPSYNDGTFIGLLRALAGGYVDLTGTFTSHSDYPKQIKYQAQSLQALGYLLKPDADAIIREAAGSDIGNP
jgi:hypothetical protein